MLWALTYGGLHRMRSKGPGQGDKPSDSTSTTRSCRPCRSTLMLGHGQRVGRTCRRRHTDLGPGQGRQHRQAAIAGTQVEHFGGVLALSQASKRAIGDQLGNEAAGHDGAFVHVKRHALQPGFAGQVSGRVGGSRCAARPMSSATWLLIRRTVDGACCPRSCRSHVQRHSKLPEHQPHGLVEGVGGAVAEGQLGGFQARCLGQRVCKVMRCRLSCRESQLLPACDGRCFSGARCRPPATHSSILWMVALGWAEFDDLRADLGNEAAVAGTAGGGKFGFQARFQAGWRARTASTRHAGRGEKGAARPSVQARSWSAPGLQAVAGRGCRSRAVEGLRAWIRCRSGN
jgi:hypothetical protein